MIKSIYASKGQDHLLVPNPKIVAVPWQNIAQSPFSIFLCLPFRASIYLHYLPRPSTVALRVFIVPWRMVLGGVDIFIKGWIPDMLSDAILVVDLQNKKLQRFPIDGYTWSEYRETFVTTTDHQGVWIDGLESAMKYVLWDGDISSYLYPGPGYGRRTIDIP